MTVGLGLIHNWFRVVDLFHGLFRVGVYGLFKVGLPYLFTVGLGLV